MLREVGLPNCYTLTKHMAECLLADAHTAGRMRVAIVRPSVIGCLACSPLPGYFGNAAGVTSATLAFASGPTSHIFCAHCCGNFYCCFQDLLVLSLKRWETAGMARFVCHDPRNVFDVIPCDVVASVVLLSAAALHLVTNSRAHIHALSVALPRLHVIMKLLV